MSDILLQKPQAGQVVTVTPQADDRIILDFDANDAFLEREDNNLNMSFEDESAIILQDFYVAYTADNMPIFIIGEEIVDGDTFFAALTSELKPAAGNESSSGSGFSVQLISGSLQEGLHSLGGVESGFTPGEQRDGMRALQPTDETAPDAEVTGDVTLQLEGDDNFINAVEEADGITLSGIISNVSGEVSNLVVVIDSIEYTVANGGLTLNGNEFTVTVPNGTLADGNYTATVTGTVTDGDGNTLNLSAQQDFTLDTVFGDGTDTTTLTLDSIEDDGIIDEKELPDGIEVSGTVTGLFSNGDTVTINVLDTNGNPVLDDNGNPYIVTTTVDAAGNFNATLDGKYYDDGKYTLSATVAATDDIGNTNSASDSKDVVVSSTTMELEVDDVVGDRYYNENVTGKIDVNFNGNPEDFTFIVKIGGKEYEVEASTGGTIKLPSTGLPGNSQSEVIITPVPGKEGEYTFTYIPYGTGSSDAKVEFEIVLEQKETGHTEVGDVKVDTIHRDIEVVNIGNFNQYSTNMTIEGEYSGPNLRPYNYSQLQHYFNSNREHDFVIEGTQIGTGYRTTHLTTHNGDDQITINSTGSAIYAYNNNRYHGDTTNINMGNGNDELTLNVQNSSGDKYGILTTSTGSRAYTASNVNMGNDDDILNINIINNTGQGRAIWTQGEGGHTNVNMGSGNDEININVTGNSAGYGVASYGGTSNVNLNAGNDTVTINVSENRGNAYGIYAARQGHGASKTANINLGEDNDTLTINVHNNNGAGYGLYSHRSNGPAPAANVRMGSGNDNLIVDVTGNKNGNYALFSNLSSNNIYGEANDDNISLNGYIATNGGTNLIDGGADHDTLALTNTVSNNSMTFKGDADNLDMHYGAGSKQADINNMEEIRFGWEFDAKSDQFVKATDHNGDGQDDAVAANYNVDFSQVAAAADGSGLTIITADGNDTIKGTQGADEIYAGYGDDIIFGDMGDKIFAEAGDDLIDMSDTLNFDDVLVDGGEGMDVLLVGAANLNDAKSMLGADITNTEIIIAGDNITGATTAEIFTEIGINTNGDMFELSSSNWTKGTSINGYTELTNNDDSSITILVETTKLDFS